jgi:hypothetical protein
VFDIGEGGRSVARCNGGKEVTNLLYPSWQISYQEVLLESDPQKVESKMLAAETAIFLRFQELASVNSESTDERSALSDALRTLRTLQVDKLNYPKLPGENRQNQ